MCHRNNVDKTEPPGEPSGSPVMGFHTLPESPSVTVGTLSAL